MNQYTKRHSERTQLASDKDALLNQGFNVLLLMEWGLPMPWAEHVAKQWQDKCTELAEERTRLAALNLCKPGFLDRVIRQRDEALKQLVNVKTTLRAVVSDIEEYERINKLAPNAGRSDCWDSVAAAKALLADEDRPA